MEQTSQYTFFYSSPVAFNWEEGERRETSPQTLEQPGSFPRRHCSSPALRALLPYRVQHGGEAGRQQLSRGCTDITTLFLKHLHIFLLVFCSHFPKLLLPHFMEYSKTKTPNQLGSWTKHSLLRLVFFLLGSPKAPSDFTQHYSGSPSLALKALSLSPAWGKL